MPIHADWSITTTFSPLAAAHKYISNTSCTWNSPLTPLPPAPPSPLGSDY